VSSLDQPVGVEQQDIADPDLNDGLGVAAIRVGAQHRPAERGQRLGRA